LALKELPNLPKGKLLKLTGFFFIGALATYYVTGPYKKNKYMRHYHNGEELYGLHSQHSSVISTEKPYSQNYGLDYKEVIDASKAGAAETEMKSSE